MIFFVCARGEDIFKEHRSDRFNVRIYANSWLVQPCWEFSYICSEFDFWNQIVIKVQDYFLLHHPTHSREHILELRMYVMHTFTHCLAHFASAMVIYFLLPSGVPRLDLEINNTCLGGNMKHITIFRASFSPNFHVDGTGYQDTGMIELGGFLIT